jgi:thiamine-phosphate pyrophosphorylase
MQRYAITDRHLLTGSEPERRAALVELTARWAKSGVDYIQIREKDLSTSELRELTEKITAVVHKENQATKILLNGPAQIALEAGADGIHLPANALMEAASQARTLFDRAGREATVSHACHTHNEVLKVREESQLDLLATTENTLILYAPIFEKRTPEGKLQGQGLEAIKSATEAAGNIPVFALGGVTKENAQSCIEAGAAGIAAIRLFLNNKWQEAKFS